MFDLPALPGPARDAVILDHIRNNDYEVDWTVITSDVNGHHAEFRVFSDALKIAGIRVSVSAFLQQTIADMLGCSLLTAKLMDLMFAQRAVTLLPHTQTPDQTMVTTAVMIKQSQWIDSQIPPNSTGIIQTIGKSWLVDNLFTTNTKTAGKAINYGWHLLNATFQGVAWPKSVTLPGVYTIQNRGWAHAPQEVDYSQNCLLVARDCRVDNTAMDLTAVLSNPALAPLANADGVLHTLRQPGVPIAPFVRAPPCVGPNCPAQVLYAPAAPSQASLGLLALAMAGAGFLGVFALDS